MGGRLRDSVIVYTDEDGEEYILDWDKVSDDSNAYQCLLIEAIECETGHNHQMIRRVIEEYNKLRGV